MFSGSSNLLIAGGSFINISSETVTRAREILLENSAPGAFDNSAERFDPSKCHPGTRTHILTKVMDWVIAKVGLDGFIKWLYGPAGAGKSVIAQAIAEMCHDRHLLLASFVFSRTDPKRNNEKCLIASIAYQITLNAPVTRHAIEDAVNKYPAIFQRSIEAQLTALIIDPLTQLSKTGTLQSTSIPNLIIIDGLDECNDHRVQRRILHIISSAVKQPDVPLKFLICSRAEPHLTFEFTSLASEGMATPLSLDDGYGQDAVNSVHKIATDFQTKYFHSTVLPNLHVSVYYALTTFETAISPWMHPSEWLDANTKHICTIFDGFVKCTGNEAVKLPEIKVFQRLIVYIFAYNMVCTSDNRLVELSVILKKCRDRDILNLIRSQANIKNELWTLFQNASREHREKKHDDLFKKLLILDSISLSANIEVLIADQDTYEDVVETTGAGAQSLVNILHARLDFPMLPEHKRLLVGALTRLSERSGVYPDSLTLTNVTPERGRRAAGGFADVYKGRCLGEDIALKVFKIPLPSGVNSLNSWRSSDARFQNLIHEVITWRQLSHPNVLPFYGVHFLEEPLEIRFCLVSPWMEHGNIVEFLVRQHRDGPYTDTTDCVSLALDVANGVKYLHGEGVIHRDLKGYNILISPSPRAYIADFGLATFTDSGSATTLAGSAIMGTPKWLAPELIPHEEAKRHHTYASDIYAFALMFSGKLPFEDVQIYDLKPLLQRGKRPSLPADDLSQRRGLSSEMEGLIRDCWAQEPAERPSADNVVERLQLLRKHQDDQPPLDKIGTSFFTQLLRDQADNPFAILSTEYQGTNHSSQVSPNEVAQQPQLHGFDDRHSQLSQISPPPSNISSHPPSPSAPIDTSAGSSLTSRNSIARLNIPLPDVPLAGSGVDRPQTPQQPGGNTVLFYVTARYDYTATIEEEFDFRAGDVIAVTATPDDGWWSGELWDEARRVEGKNVFPRNFVSPVIGHTAVLFYVKALHDYTATIEEEFDFRAGDVIAVSATQDDGWWSGVLLDEGRRVEGRHVFPSNFVIPFVF